MAESILFDIVLYVLHACVSPIYVYYILYAPGLHEEKFVLRLFCVYVMINLILDIISKHFYKIETKAKEQKKWQKDL
ncbi:MAG: hypothetical protein IJV59_05250, partial [Eubacterium sp.]|nr:hypothetical protein [Eubacterium sp.]